MSDYVMIDGTAYFLESSDGGAYHLWSGTPSTDDAGNAIFADRICLTGPESGYSTDADYYGPYSDARNAVAFALGWNGVKQSLWMAVRKLSDQAAQDELKN